jgi:phosphocarrier protein HPr
MFLQSVQLKRKAGLDGPAINRLVQVTSRFESDIFLTYKGRKVNLKSIMGVLSLAIPNHAELILEASGMDDKEALEEIKKTIESLS